MPTNRHNSTRAALTALLIAGGASCNRHETEADAELPGGGSVTVWTDSTELFMEYPALIVGRPEKFAVHLTDITDFAPLRSGRITLRFVSNGGDSVVVIQETPRSPGIYGPAPEFTRPGVYRLTIEVESPQARDVITVPDLDLQVVAREAELPEEEGGEPEGIAFLKEQQWKTPGFATAFATTGTVPESFEALGELVPVAGRMARVSAPIASLVEATGLADAPLPGQRVTRGQALVTLTPTLGEGGSAYAKARAELREAEAEHARAKRLFEAEAISARRLQEAESRLRAAREALSAYGEEPRADGRLVIRSPISGVVATRNLTPGSRVDAGQELFVIVDPSVLWLEVHLPADQAARVGKKTGARFTVPGDERIHPTTRLISIGSMIDPLSRTVTAIYEVRNPDGSLKIGSHAKAAMETGRPVEGVLIPSTAVLEEDGRPIAFVQAEGERFERRQLEIGGGNGLQVLVRSGIGAGERVVTGAAYQVRLASLSTAAPAHGHEH